MFTTLLTKLKILWIWLIEDENINKKEDKTNKEEVENISEISIPLVPNKKVRFTIKINIPQTTFYRIVVKDFNSNQIIKTGIKSLQLNQNIDPICIGINPNIGLTLKIHDWTSVREEDILWFKILGQTERILSSPNTAKKMKSANKVFRSLIKSDWKFVLDKHGNQTRPFIIGPEKK